MVGIIGSGSWGTALAKILTDNGHQINWWIRNADTIQQIQKRKHNPHYLSSAYFDTSLLWLGNDLHKIVQASDIIVIAVPSAFVEETFKDLDPHIFKNKKIVSAIKGILPRQNVLLNAWLLRQFHVPLEDYFVVLGPCHAEEVAGPAQRLADHFQVSVRTVQRWKVRGLPSIGEGGTVRYRISDAESWLGKAN